MAAIVASGHPLAAHEEVPGVRPVIDSIEPPLPAGVVVQTAISVADQLVVENTTDTELVVLGEAGEPFLRIGKEGVFANLKSPTWYRSNDPSGTAAPPADADPKAEPVYGRASREPAWGWFDHRMHRTRLSGAPSVESADTPVRLESWEIPMRYGTTAVLVKGHREFRLPPGAFETKVLKFPDGLPVTALGGGAVPLLAASIGRSVDVPITIIGEQGEPMARLSSRVIEVNESSPTYVFTAESKGGYRRNGPVGAGEAPRWSPMGAKNQFSWLERRAQIVTPDGTGTPGQEQRWTVPVLVGDTAGAIEGVTTWVPSKVPVVAGGDPPGPDDSRDGSADWPVYVGLAAAAGGLTLAVYFGVARLRRPRAG